MLRVRLEIVPFGDETKTREIGQLHIFNKRDEGWGFAKYGGIEINTELNSAAMFDFDIYHKRVRGAWELVRKFLQERSRYEHN